MLFPAVSVTYRWNSTGITVAGGTNGTANNELNLPYGILVDSSNAIYVADQNNNRVQKFLSGSLTATTIAGQSTGTSGTSLADLDKPTGIAFDSTGNIYVADRVNHRIQYWATGATTGVRVAGTG